MNDIILSLGKPYNPDLTIIFCFAMLLTYHILGALLSKNDMVKLLKYPCFKRMGYNKGEIKSKIDYVSKVHSTLYKFSLGRLNSITSKGFCKLILKYSDIHTYKDMSESESNLFDEIKNICVKTISE